LVGHGSRVVAGWLASIVKTLDARLPFFSTQFPKFTNRVCYGHPQLILKIGHYFGQREIS
jgi:hypothetical protein